MSEAIQNGEMKLTMIKRFKDFYGGKATIKPTTFGTILTIRSGYGKLVHKKTYKTERGARIAMGRISEGWREL